MRRLAKTVRVWWSAGVEGISTEIPSFEDSTETERVSAPSDFTAMPRVAALRMLDESLVLTRPGAQM